MVKRIFEEIKVLALENCRKCISEDILLEKSEKNGLSILEMSKLTDKLVNDGIKVVSKEEYENALKDTKKYKFKVDKEIQFIVEQFNKLSLEKRSICIKVLNDIIMGQEEVGNSGQINCGTMLYLKGKNHAAKGYMNNDKFVVMKGSLIEKDVRGSCRESLKKKRNELISTGKVVDCIFTEDVEFGSPSTAAAVIIGGEANGLIEWKNIDGVKLKDIK